MRFRHPFLKSKPSLRRLNYHCEPRTPPIRDRMKRVDPSDAFSHHPSSPMLKRMSVDIVVYLLAFESSCRQTCDYAPYLSL